MTQRTILLTAVTALLLVSAGCLGGNANQPTIERTQTTTAQDVPLRTWSLTQETADSGTAVRITGMVLNTGDRSVNGSMKITLLNESSPVASRTVQLQEVSPEEQVEFSVVLEVRPSRVDGRRVSFSR
jgi:hypothetical protein